MELLKDGRLVSVTVPQRVSYYSTLHLKFCLYRKIIWEEKKKRLLYLDIVVLIKVASFNILSYFNYFILIGKVLDLFLKQKLDWR